MPKTLKLKVESDKATISEFINRIQDHYLLAHQSKLIEHQENNLSHIYLSLVDLGGNQ